ncbi:MAG: diguanylate cyclase domain-containing protein [Christensenellales bacterium]|jgi:diguanylate cyclase (GGDEF)-like protein
MIYSFFKNTFNNLQMPVIVCESGVGNNIVYANPCARLLLNPLLPIGSIMGKSRPSSLSAMLKLSSDDAAAGLFSMLASSSTINKHKAKVITFEGGHMDISISANLVDVENKKYYVLYLCETGPDCSPASVDTNNILSTAFNIAYHAHDTDSAINKILALVGLYAQISRVYIIEETSTTLTSNTYEWCNAGIKPVMHCLQNMCKDEYHYEIIMNGIYISNDIRDLPAKDRALLEKQDIKSIALLPLSHLGKGLGYVGFDVCEARRLWTAADINILKHVADILVSLLIRRNMGHQVKRSLELLQTVSDSLNNVYIYVTDIQTDEIIFASKNLCENLDISPQDIASRKCWELLQKGQSGRCGFCPLRTMLDEDGNIIADSYSWDFQNTMNGRWYLVKDSIIKWIDGRDVHIETATEISWSKEYEEELTRLAIRDEMTGAFNREWGYKIIRDAVRCAQSGLEGPFSLVFMNIDGLKAVNGAFGYEAGDSMIVQTVDIIRSSVRQNDFICRWRGDKFIMLLRCDEKIADRILSHIGEKLAAVNAEGKNPFTLSFSHGIAAVDPRKGESVDALIAAADKIMYINKMQKRSRYRPAGD